MKNAVISRRMGLLLLAGAGLSLAGCSQVKRLTGQNDNTVLPGERETILPPSQTTGQSPDIARKSASGSGGMDQGTGGSTATAPDDLAACDPETDTGCNMTGSSSSSGSGDDIFSDGQ